LENEAKSSQEKFEEITRKWTDAKMKQTPLHLRDALKNQQQLCEQLKANKIKLISELQQVNTHTSTCNKFIKKHRLKIKSN